MSTGTGKLIHDFTMEIATPECAPTTTLWRMKVLLQDDIAEALPYLNAWLKNAEYNHTAGVLLWEDGGKRYAFRPGEIAVAPVVDREEAQVTASSVIGMVNDVWNRRYEIEPDFEGKRPPPNLLDIYRLLPGTNCKECGYPTCMAYAADLREGKVVLAQCLHLLQPEHAENRLKLSDILVS